MNNESTSGNHAKLFEAAYRQTLARFHDQVANGERDPAAELATYKKRRRDYATLLRLDTIPDEARELAAQLISTHHLALDADARRAFERDTAALLVRLYDAFIGTAGVEEKKNPDRDRDDDLGE